MVNKLTKIDHDRRQVFGWANVSVRKNGQQIVDVQGHLIDPSDLETAAYHFVLEYRETGANHAGECLGHLIESLMVTPEKLDAMGLAKSALPIGWWVGFQIDDDATWEKVKKGDFQMFSIQGVAELEEVS